MDVQLTNLQELGDAVMLIWTKTSVSSTLVNLRDQKFKLFLRQKTVLTVPSKLGIHVYYSYSLFALFSDGHFTHSNYCRLEAIELILVKR